MASLRISLAVIGPAAYTIYSILGITADVYFPVIRVRVRIPISPPYDYAALIAKRPVRVRVRIRPFSSAVTICKMSTLIVKLYPFCALQRNVSK